MSFFEPENLRAVTKGRWLQRPAAPIALRGVGIDTRDDLRNKAFVAIKGDRFDGHDFLSDAVKAGAALLIVDRKPSSSAGLEKAGVLLVENTRKALAAMSLAYRRTLLRTTVIAVVGSAGKTTTKRLIDAALTTAMQGTVSPKSFNNDIGVPLTILSAKSTDTYLVVEVGTNHLGEIAPLAAMIEPDIAVISMIGREHLEGLGTLENIAQENAELLKYLRATGVAVVNADATLLRPYLTRLPTVILFGEAKDADIRLSARGYDDASGHWWFEIDGRTRFGLSLPGKHNAMNAMAAVAIARRLGVPDQRISNGLASAPGAPMRSAVQWIGGEGGVMLCNDAYNANPDSMAAALETFEELTNSGGRIKRRIVILGDMLELGEAGPELHRDVGRRILELDSRAHINHAVFVGELSAFAAAEVAKRWQESRINAVGILDAGSIAEIARLVKPGDAVLLKGSRGMGLERIAAALEEQAAPASRASAAPHLRSAGKIARK